MNRKIVEHGLNGQYRIITMPRDSKFVGAEYAKYDIKLYFETPTEWIDPDCWIIYVIRLQDIIPPNYRYMGTVPANGIQPLLTLYRELTDAQVAREKSERQEPDSTTRGSMDSDQGR